MLRKIYHDFRRLGSRLRDRSAPPRRVIHPIPSEEVFFQALDEGSCADLKHAKTEFQRGNRKQAIKETVHYFRTRPRDNFFVSSAEIRSLVEEVRDKRPDWIARTLEQADEMSRGYLNVYSRKTCFRSPEDWAFAPLGPADDMLYRYRPHRFAFAPRLALASLYGHTESGSALEKFVFDWADSVDSERVFQKKHRTFRASSHVALYRSIALSWVQAFLSADPRPDYELEMMLFRIILGDALYIQESIPTTTRNNHLLADGFGLWYLGSVYPEFSAASDWVADGYPVFKRELLRQIYPDGMSFEQSVHYQEHASEMGLAYLLLSRRNGWPVDEDLEGRIEAMLFFQATVTGRDGWPVAIGDATEDPLFPLDGDEGWCGPAMRAMYGRLFDQSGLQSDQATASLERSFWLGGGDAAPGATPECRPERLQVFPMGGLAVFSAREGADRLIFRTGPAEDREVAPGHMHFDFLSVYLVVDGEVIFVPSGTYTYRADPLGWPRKLCDWRAYFMSPGAANGLITSGVDPLCRGGGDFPGGVNGEIAYRVRTGAPSHSASLAMISAQVIGVGEYANWTRYVFQVKNEYWLMVDKLPEKITSGPAWIGFQCPEGASVSSKGERVTHIDVQGVEISLSNSGAVGTPLCLDGSSRPRGGWVSSRYGHITGAPQLRFRLKSDTEYCAFAICGKRGLVKFDDAIEIRRTEAGIQFVCTSSAFEDTFDFGLAGADPSSDVNWKRRIDDQVVAEERLTGARISAQVQ